MYVHFVWGYFDKCGGDFAVGDLTCIHQSKQETCIKQCILMRYDNKDKIFRSYPVHKTFIVAVKILLPCCNMFLPFCIISVKSPLGLVLYCYFNMPTINKTDLILVYKLTESQCSIHKNIYIKSKSKILIKSQGQLKIHMGTKQLNLPFLPFFLPKTLSTTVINNIW